MCIYHRIIIIISCISMLSMISTVKRSHRLKYNSYENFMYKLWFVSGTYCTNAQTHNTHTHRMNDTKTDGRSEIDIFPFILSVSLTKYVRRVCFYPMITSIEKTLDDIAIGINGNIYLPTKCVYSFYLLFIRYIGTLISRLDCCGCSISKTWTVSSFESIIWLGIKKIWYNQFRT